MNRERERESRFAFSAREHMGERGRERKREKEQATHSPTHCPENEEMVLILNL